MAVTVFLWHALVTISNKNFSTLPVSSFFTPPHVGQRPDGRLGDGFDVVPLDLHVALNASLPKGLATLLSSPSLSKARRTYVTSSSRGAIISLFLYLL